MSLFAKAVQLSVACLTLAGLANFKFDRIAGIAAVANVTYWALGDLVWRTKEA